MKTEYKTEVFLELEYSKDYEYDSINTEMVTISWSAEVINCSWGIKDVSFFVPEQEININADVFETVNSTNTVNKNITLKIENVIVVGYPSLPLSPDKLSNENGVWKLHF